MAAELGILFVHGIGITRAARNQGGEPTIELRDWRRSSVSVVMRMRSDGDARCACRHCLRLSRTWIKRHSALVRLPY